MLDRDPANFSLHPDNGIIVPPLTGKADDPGLVQLIPFLEAVALLNVQDVRAVVRKYGQTGTAEAFRIEQARLRLQHIADWKAKGGKPTSAAAPSGGFLRGIGAALGFAAPAPTAPLPTFADGAPPMHLDLLRARQQRIYADNAKFFAENRAAMEAQQKADQEKAMRECVGARVGALTLQDEDVSARLPRRRSRPARARRAAPASIGLVAALPSRHLRFAPSRRRLRPTSKISLVPLEDGRRTAIAAARTASASSLLAKSSDACPVCAGPLGVDPLVARLRVWPLERRPPLALALLTALRLVDESRRSTPLETRRPVKRSQPGGRDSHEIDTSARAREGRR